MLRYCLLASDDAVEKKYLVYLCSKSMGSYSELLEGDLESMHPVAECVLGSDNEPVFDFQKVLRVESHLWAQPFGGIDLCDLNELLVNILLEDHI